MAGRRRRDPRRVRPAQRKVRRKMTRLVYTAVVLVGTWSIGSFVYAQAANADGTGFAGAYAPSKIWQPPKDQSALEKLKKFQDLKFGFFYCWGTQTQWETIDQSWSLCPERYDWNKRPGVHANDDTLTYKKAYEGLIRTFNPVKFNPEQVAEIAEAAGTRYLVFCTKHHDGFCFWDTKTTDYKITSKGCPYHVNPTPMSPRDSSMPSAREGFGSARTFPRRTGTCRITGPRSSARPRTAIQTTLPTSIRKCGRSSRTSPGRRSGN